jgi:hypothetical protein
MLNSDIANNTVDIYDIESHKGLKGELDTRLLTEKGRDKIAEDILKSSMITDTINQIVTNETVDVTDFFDNVDKEYKTFDAIKEKIAQTPELASMLQDSTLSTEQKEAMMDAITDEVMAKLGYKTVDNKIINTTSSGRDEAQTKGFYSEETENSYINEKYVTTNEGLIATSGSEAQRAIDSQNNEIWSDEQRNDRAEFVQHVGENIVDYTNFSMNISGYDNGISTSQNNIEQPKTVTQTPSVFNNPVANNNQDFTVLDKTKGDNLCVNSMDCYGNKTETVFLKTQSVMTNENVGNYNLINQVNPDNGNVEYYSLYNNQTGNTINLKPQELDNLQQMAETNPEAFKNIMAVYEMQSNTTHTTNNAIMGLHDDGYLGGNLDAWQKEITSGEILFDIAPGGVAAKVEKNLVTNVGKSVDNTIDLGVLKKPNPSVKIEPGQDVLLTKNDGLEVRLPNEGKFENVVADGETTHLFTIDNDGLKVINENTSVGGNDVAKHTNLSSEAAFGGEVKFNTDGSVTINPYSGRFGVGNSVNDAETITKLESTKKYFESLGYDVKVEFEPKTTSNTIVTDSIVNGKDSAVNLVTSTQLKTKLAFEEAGILTKNGKLTSEAIENAQYIPLKENGQIVSIKNPTIVQELTKDGSKIEDWSKYKTNSVTMPNGQRLQIHFYKNKTTGKVDYITEDYKVKGIVNP